MLCICHKSVFYRINIDRLIGYWQNNIDIFTVCTTDISDVKIRIENEKEN